MGLLLCYHYGCLSGIFGKMSNWHSLEDLYKLHYTEIFRYLLRRVRHKEIAQDLTQDTFLKAFNGLSTFKGNSSVKTWLYTIAHNTFINWYRKETKYKQDLFEHIDLIDENFYKNPAVFLEKKITQQNILRAIHALKVDYQHVIILREFQQLSYGEIAEVLDWKLSKVKTNLHRAKLELRKSLSKVEGDRNEM